jgi:lysophospholipase L1-like esterase
LFSTGKAISPLVVPQAEDQDETNPLVLSKGLSGKGLDLRLGGYVSHQDDLEIVDALTQITLCGWVYSSAPFKKGRVWINNQDGDKNGFKLYEVNDQGVLRFEIMQKDAPIYAQLDSEPGFLVTDQWTFFAVTFDGNRAERNVRFYRASPATLITDACEKFSTGYISPISDDLAPFSICGSSFGGEQFPALIDNFTVYDQVLAPKDLEEIRAGHMGTQPGKGLNIYCFGDSMVSGCCGGPHSDSFGQGGFRYYLEQTFLDEEVSYTFSGPSRSGTLNTGGKIGPLFSPFHGGAEGEKIPELLEMLKENKAISLASPDIVIVYIGTGMTGWIELDQFQIDTKELKKEYDLLLDEIEKQTNEQTQIFLCRLVPASSLLPHVNKRVNIFNGEVIDTIFEERLEEDRGENYHWIDLYGALDWENDLANIGHPNSSGHEKVAEVLWQEIQSLEGFSLFPADINGSLSTDSLFEEVSLKYPIDQGTPLD